MLIQIRVSCRASPAILLPGRHWQEGAGLFADLLTDCSTALENPAAQGAYAFGRDTTQDHVETLKEKGFTGFFKKIEEEKLEKLREEILRGMGLTEEKLAEMPPEQRSAIEKRIAEEIQRRMAVGSMDNEDPGSALSHGRNGASSTALSGSDLSSLNLGQNLEGAAGLSSGMIINTRPDEKI